MNMIAFHGAERFLSPKRPRFGKESSKKKPNLSDRAPQPPARLISPPPQVKHSICRPKRRDSFDLVPLPQITSSKYEYGPGSPGRSTDETCQPSTSTGHCSLEASMQPSQEKASSKYGYGPGSPGRLAKNTLSIPKQERRSSIRPVSYTHLTLPTKA